MSFEIKYPVLIVTQTLWLGFLLAISFLEAWLKFRAPGVTIPIGLGIGKLVFGALNRIEWFFLFVLFFHLFTYFKELNNSYFIFAIILFITLITQTFYLLPALDQRADIYISGETPPSSSLHLYYVFGEVFKTITLILFILNLFKRIS